MTFINNFIVSLAYRKFYAGQIVQRGGHPIDEIYIIWKGQVVVTEQSEFAEPILVYQRGTVFNLYQVLMETDLPFNYIAAAEDEFQCNIPKNTAVE